MYQAWKSNRIIISSLQTNLQLTRYVNDETTSIDKINNNIYNIDDQVPYAVNISYLFPNGRMW